MVTSATHLWLSEVGVGQAKWRCSCGVVQTWEPIPGEDWSLETLTLCSEARWQLHVEASGLEGTRSRCGTSKGISVHNRSKEPLCIACKLVYENRLAKELVASGKYQTQRRDRIYG